MKFRVSAFEGQGQKFLLGLLSIGVVLIFSGLFSRLSFPDSSYNFLGKDKRVELEPGKNVTQTFVARRDGLDRIKIMIGDLDTLGYRDSVSLALAERDCETLIATATITMLAPEPKIYSSFDFNRIEHSAGQTYCLKISYTAAERPKKRPYLAASEGTSFTDTAYFDEAKSRTYAGRSLQMRPSYSHASSWDNLRELEQRLSQYKPAFMKGSVLALGLASALGSIALVWILIRIKDE